MRPSGTWLLFAPLLFWAPECGGLHQRHAWSAHSSIAFAILVPMMPGMSMAAMSDHSDVPPGWSYSPSTYLQRLPIIVLGAVGWLIARVLTAYQLGHIDAVWEPFFAGSAPPLNGTEQIITSEVSKAWPVADAGLGAVAYAFEVLMGVMGDRRRWRTMPWMVVMFGITVVPLGVVSIYFIVIQPIVIGTWCTLCLVTAAAMLVMIPYSLDELVATGQFLVQSWRRGEPFWRTFFRGGAQPAGAQHQRDQRPDFDAPVLGALGAAAGGVVMPWTLVASAMLGIVLMFSRVLFGNQPPVADSRPSGRRDDPDVLGDGDGRRRPAAAFRQRRLRAVAGGGAVAAGRRRRTVGGCGDRRRGDRAEPAARPPQRRTLRQLGPAAAVAGTAIAAPRFALFACAAPRRRSRCDESLRCPTTSNRRCNPTARTRPAPPRSWRCCSAAARRCSCSSSRSPAWRCSAAVARG